MTDNWYCIYTKQGHEDCVACRIAGLEGLEVFNPKIKTRKMVRSKPLEVVQELFPCYLFANIENESHFHTISYTRGVRRFVAGPTGRPHIVDPCIIEAIKSRIYEGFVCIEPKKFATGEEVAVVDGPFAGLTGLFLQELNACERVIILLSAIDARLELDKTCLAGTRGLR